MMEKFPNLLTEKVTQVQEAKRVPIKMNSKRPTKRHKQNEDSLRELQDNMKHNNIQILGIPEGEEKEQRIEHLFEKVMAENFPNLIREKVTQV